MVAVFTILIFQDQTWLGMGTGQVPLGPMWRMCIAALAYAGPDRAPRRQRNRLSPAD